MWKWRQGETLPARSFVCGYCGKLVGSATGYYATDMPVGVYAIYLCPNCSKPTFFDSGRQVPGVTPGTPVKGLPPEIESIYDEARQAIAAGAYTASVLVSRKLLMNVAVNEGAEPAKSFLEYVEHLAANGYIPPRGRAWVDHIRKKGNEATHEIHVMTQSDAEELITFAEMLLKFIYEFPQRVPPATKAN